MLTLIFSTFDLSANGDKPREVLVNLLLARASRIIVRFPVSGQYPTAGQIFKLHLKELELNGESDMGVCSLTGTFLV